MVNSCKLSFLSFVISSYEFMNINMNYERFDVKYLECFTYFEEDTLDILNNSIYVRILRIFCTYQILLAFTLFIFLNI